MKLCFVGTGYVGLVGAAVFADWGNEVIGVDIDKEKIAKIEQGHMPIYEPGLAEMVAKNISEGRLKFTSSLAEGIANAEIVFICVGTPQDEHGSANLTYVFSVAKEIASHIKDYKIIVTKSTVPVGTNEQVKKLISENLKHSTDFDVASNPEFLREGSSVEDMKNTDRTVIGSDSPRALEKLRQLYKHLTSPIVECDLRSAEMIKYASNSFLATKISFINEIAQLCDRTGADVATVSVGMGLDKRIGRSFLNAGIGYGGSCFPKDVSALYRTSSDLSYDFKLLRTVMEVNKTQKEHFVNKIIKYYGNTLMDKKFACLGLAFKGNTDDIRDSVAIEVIKILRGLGAFIYAYDPQAITSAQKVLGNTSIKYCENIQATLKDSDALILLTEWQEFAVLNLDNAYKELRDKVIFDGRNLLDRTEVEAKGFTYFAVGKGLNGLGK